MSSRIRRRARGTHGKAFRLGVGALIAVGALAALLLSAGVTLAVSWLDELPDYTSQSAFDVSKKTKVYANDATTLIAEFYVEDREPVPAEQISDYVKDGTVATEDERFFEHGGVDLEGIARAIFVNLTSGQTVEGASTITQQLVRNTLLLEEMSDITLKRKVREAYIAMQMESVYTKQEILTMYLNTINYGDGAYGVEAAALHYFSKNASDLTLSEAALLVGIPQSPTYNNPKEYPENAIKRRNLVLDRMLSNGYITQEEHDAAAAEELVLDPLMDEGHGDGIYLYPYFTSWVRKLLLDEYSYDEVYRGGMTVITTIDPAKQEAAENACYDKLRSLESDVDMSLTSIDPKTGYVVALFGGRDYYTDQFNLATQAERQAGSCFKTFTLTASIEAGISPTTIVSCSSPVTFGNWRVENYGGATYGAKTIQGATQISSNTAYARLVELIGANKVVEVAKRMGITSNLEPVPSITLGSQGVNTLQMASAYGTLAAGGMYHKPKFYTLIENSHGDVLYDATKDEPEGVRALTPEVAGAVTSVLETVVTGGTATRARLSNQVSAGKTGTSQNYRDSMYCGYTPQLSTAVWIGARQERSVADNMGGSNCCPVWRAYMSAALAGVPSENFPTVAAPPYNSTAAAGLNELGFSPNNGPEEEEENKEEEEGEEGNKPENPAAPSTPDPAPTPAPAPETPPEAIVD